jgi:hypothetical protein
LLSDVNCRQGHDTKGKQAVSVLVARARPCGVWEAGRKWADGQVGTHRKYQEPTAKAAADQEHYDNRDKDPQGYVIEDGGTV